MRVFIGFTNTFFMSLKMKLSKILILLRPHQWIKNCFIFFPLFFNRHLFDFDYLIPCILLFFSFSFASSGIYCLNDICDAESDKKHPEKRKRPIASGAVSKKAALVLTFGCFIVSYIIITILCGSMKIYGIISFYIAMNIAYCLKLKQIAIVDVFTIAVGFVLRVLVGGFATSISLSQWIVLMTFLLALFLAFAKRRDDVIMYENSGVKMRRNVNRYNLDFMNQLIVVVACLTMMCYIMYTVSPEVIERFHSSYIYLTSVFVLAGIIRYLQITMVDVKSGSPTKVLMKDHFVQGCIVGWILSFVLIIYL